MADGHIHVSQKILYTYLYYLYHFRSVQPAMHVVRGTVFVVCCWYAVKQYDIYICIYRLNTHSPTQTEQNSTTNTIQYHVSAYGGTSVVPNLQAALFMYIV